MFDDIINKPKRRMLKAEWTFESKADLNVFYDESFFDSIMEEVEKENREIIENVIKDAQTVKEYDIYIKPVKAAEFIVFNSVITKTGAILNV